MVVCQAHNLEVAGSNPAPATEFFHSFDFRGLDGFGQAALETGQPLLTVKFSFTVQKKIT